MPDPSTPPLAGLRRAYAQAALNESLARPDPFDQFAVWFEEAQASDTAEPNAMALATVSPDGRPAVRMVLLKAFDARGLAFYTNFDSRKGHELDATGVAAVVFWWPTLERQVRVEGHVERVPDAEADAYFAERPRGSRLGAWASPQSRIVADRTELDEALAQAEAAHAEEAVPRPPFWGGYRLLPDHFEFWQGRPDRLHDRLTYRREPNGDGWRLQRLAP